MTEGLALKAFASHLHTRFRIAQAADCELELTEIIDSSSAQLEQFSLIFTGTASPWLRQGLYTLLHPLVKECELLLVPLGPDAAGMRYEAVFSRFTRAPDAAVGSL